MKALFPHCSEQRDQAVADLYQSSEMQPVRPSRLPPPQRVSSMRAGSFITVANETDKFTSRVVRDSGTPGGESRHSHVILSLILAMRRQVFTADQKLPCAQAVFKPSISTRAYRDVGALSPAAPRRGLGLRYGDRRTNRISPAADA